MKVISNLRVYIAGQNFSDVRRVVANYGSQRPLPMAHVELEAIAKRAKRLIQSNLDVSKLLAEVIPL